MPDTQEPSVPNELPRELLRGVFSKKKKATVGFGGTKKQIWQNVLYFVEEQQDGKVGVQTLNNNFVPRGELNFITREELVKDYNPEPEIYMEKVFPAIRHVTKTIAKGERHYKQGNTYSAEYEFKNVLRVDEDNIRATFGLGLTYLERGQRDKGDLVFRRIVRMKASFEKKHKHLFNEFGIKMRKNQMYVQAMKYYARAYQLSKDDEHLLYNMARTLYEKGNYKGARAFIVKALALRSQFELAENLLKILEKKLKA